MEASVKKGLGKQTMDSAGIVARLERLPVTSMHVKIRVVAGIATLFDGYDSLSIAYVLPVLVPLWHISQAETGLLISVGSFGQLLGALFFGWLADRIGRARALPLSIGLFAVMSLACAFAWDYQSLFAGRFFQGLGLGGEVPVAAAYVSEMAKARGRGAFFLIYEAIFGYGLLLAALAGVWLVPRIGWQSLFVIGALPAFVALAMRLMLPESARWLADKGRIAEADKIVSNIEALARASGHVLEEPKLAVAIAERRQASWGELFNHRYLRRTLVVWAMWFCSYFVSYGSSTWLPSLYRTIYKLDVSTALTYGMITVAVGVGGTTVVAFLVDRTGRRPWFIGAAIGTALPLLWLGFQPVLTPTMLVVCASLSFFCNGSNSNMLYLYTAEIYPTRLRARGTSLATAWLRLGSVIGPLAVGLMLGVGGLNGVMLMFACVALVSALIGFLAIETRHRVLEEISP